MKILIIGDSHGNTGWLQTALNYGHDQGCELAISVGDFGYWPRWSGGQKFIKKIERTLAALEMNLWFVDGNHEDHERLRALGITRSRDITKHITWKPRGSDEILDGVTFGFFGGAVSVDAMARTPGYTWFSEEIPTAHEWARVYNMKNVDVMISHEVPASPLELHPGRSQWPHNLLKASQDLRDELLELQRHLKPKIWFGGHHHMRKTWTFEGTTVEVLDCDGSKPGKGYVVFDTETIRDSLL